MGFKKVDQPGRPSIAPRISQQMGVRVTDEYGQEIRQLAVDERRHLWQVVDEAFMLLLKLRSAGIEPEKFLAYLDRLSDGDAQDDTLKILERYMRENNNERPDSHDRTTKRRGR